MSGAHWGGDWGAPHGCAPVGLAPLGLAPLVDYIDYINNISNEEALKIYCVSNPKTLNFKTNSSI